MFHAIIMETILILWAGEFIQYAQLEREKNH